MGYGSTRDAIDVFFAIPKELRSRHCYVLGRTGVGKSSLLEQMILQDLRQDYTTMVFDAGDLIPSLLQKMDDETQERGQLFTVEHPLPYNPLLRRRDEPGRLENEVFSLLDQITVKSSTTQPLTARMKRLLSVALRAVMQDEEPTFSTLTTYLLEEKSKLRKQLELGRDEFQTAFEGVIDRLQRPFPSAPGRARASQSAPASRPAHTEVSPSVPPRRDSFPAGSKRRWPTAAD